MTEESGQAKALGPLWALTAGAAAGAGLAVMAPTTGPTWLQLGVAATGFVLFLAGTACRHRAPTVVWLLAALAMVGGHGLHQRSDRLAIAQLIGAANPASIRTRVVVTEGWHDGRWGHHTRARVLDATRRTEDIPLPRHCRLEIRGEVDPRQLPIPGAVIDVLVSLRGDPSSPLLVASSPRLITPVDQSSLLPTARQALVERLLAAAGHDVGRIRSAELAATLALGRRDLVPTGRRVGWRRSGLAHVLAVSGLHVGLVAGMAWLILSVVGAGPTTTRVILLLVFPTYALLAGASPSALRAAIMGMVYIGARLAGRAIVPMAAVLLTAFILLIADPGLIGEVSFQLTVLLTAAIVRWAPPLTALLPGPRWLAAAIAVPIVAQLAAAPLVACHFSSLIPGAAASNLAIPWLLGPVVLASVAATAVAPLWPAAAGWMLDLVGAGEKLMWLAGAPGRASELVPPAVPIALLVLVLAAGSAALAPGRRARWAAIAYATLLGLSGSWWLLVPPASGTRVDLFPVADGLAVHLSTGDVHLLADGGGRRREAAAFLSSSRIRRLDAILVSHGDEDHTAGLDLVLRTTPTQRLLMPVWLARSSEAVPLLRIARRRNVRIVPVARGSRFDLGAATIEIVWPPTTDLPEAENERSLVTRIRIGSETVLLTSDIGRSTEHRLVESSNLACSVLLVPHHGSRYSASPALLDEASPEVALIAAGPENHHHHPSPKVLTRLEDRGIPYRAPIHDGRCGAKLVNGTWELYPNEGSRE